MADRLLEWLYLIEEIWVAVKDLSPHLRGFFIFLSSYSEAK